MIYLDNNATTRVAPEVVEAMLPFLTDGYFNPSSLYAPAEEVHRHVEEARASIARAIGALPTEVLFTSCASESNNTALFGAVQAGGTNSRGEPRRHIITTAVEHPAILEVVRRLRTLGYDVTELPVDRAGVDNGLGRAPGWVAKMVNGIPVASPILRSFVKVQVGSPQRDAAEISEAEARRRAIGRICAKDMFEKARREKRDMSLDPVRYGEMLKKWQDAYGLTPDELAQIEARYLNAWRAYEGAQYRADGEREKFRA